MNNNLEKKIKVSLYYMGGANIFTSLAMFFLYFQTKEFYILIAGIIVVIIGISIIYFSDTIINYIFKNDKK
jgi:hypothetical protein